MRARGAKGTTALVAAAVLLAGCVGLGGSEDEPLQDAGEEPMQGNEVQVDDDRPEPTFSDIETGPASEPDHNATLDAPPRLVTGEWWRYRFFEPLTGVEVEFVRVIADVQDDGYVIGMPHEGWYKEAVIYHSPALGDMDFDLSYHTHDIHFQPLQWPLTEGATWTTSFSGGPDMEASVEVESDTRAAVTFTNPANGNVLLTLVYDATMHEVVEFRHATVEYEILEHGYGFEGWITIPRGEDLVFLHGRFAGVLGFNGQPAPPVESIEIDGGFNRVTFIHFVGNLNGPAGQEPMEGVYRELTRAPDGTEFITEMVPGRSTLQFFEFADPDGLWEMEHVAGGFGVAFVEGIAYHQYDVHLPTGGIRTDHSHDVIR